MPPGAWRVSVYLAGWLVPARGRAEWRGRWASNLASWRVLVERGEIPSNSGKDLIARALDEAFHERFGVPRLRHLLGGPWFWVAASLSALLAIALASHGFTVTRALIGIAQDVRRNPEFGVAYDRRGDRLFEYLAPIVVASAVGAALLFLKRNTLRGRGWRCWSLLAFQVISLYVGGSLLWIEGGHALRSVLASQGFRLGIAGFGLAIGFVLAFGFATLRCVADQRSRCPVCLHRLVMPVTMGSWASFFFDPAATELVCEEGHGSLAVMECEAGPGTPDRWVELDTSWQGLFRERTR